MEACCWWDSSKLEIKSLFIKNINILWKLLTWIHSLILPQYWNYTEKYWTIKINPCTHICHKGKCDSDSDSDDSKFVFQSTFFLFIVPALLLEEAAKPPEPDRLQAMGPFWTGACLNWTELPQLRCLNLWVLCSPSLKDTCHLSLHHSQWVPGSLDLNLNCLNMSPWVPHRLNQNLRQRVPDCPSPWVVDINCLPPEGLCHSHRFPAKLPEVFCHHAAGHTSSLESSTICALPHCRPPELLHVGFWL